jgi:hypothetical protein
MSHPVPVTPPTNHHPTTTTYHHLPPPTTTCPARHHLWRHCRRLRPRRLRRQHLRRHLQDTPTDAPCAISDDAAFAYVTNTFSDDYVTNSTDAIAHVADADVAYTVIQNIFAEIGDAISSNTTADVPNDITDDAFIYGGSNGSANGTYQQ